MSDFPELTQAVIDGNRNKVIEIVNAELEKGVAPQSLLSEYMIPGMLEVGNLMQEGEYFIPEVLRSAKAMKGVLEILEPLLEASGGAQSVGYIVIGTVDGDIHDIGKNLVTMLLKGSGFAVNDLGVSVKSEAFVEALKEKEGAVLLGLSALITPTLDEMPVVIKAIEDAGLRDRVKIMVGGAPVTQEFAEEIGADGTAEDAAAAVPGAIGLSGSSVSRSFVQASAAQLKAFQERDLSAEDCVTLFLDGKTFADATMVIALGITMTGEKRLLGFIETDTENAMVLSSFLRSLVARGLDVSQGLLVIIDGGKRFVGFPLPEGDLVASIEAAIAR